MTLKNTRRSLWLVFLIQAIWFTSCHSYDKNYAIYELWVNGVKVTTRNQTDILGDGTVRYEGNGQQGVADVHHQNGGKQQNKPGTVLVDHLTAGHKQYKR